MLKIYITNLDKLNDEYIKNNGYILSAYWIESINSVNAIKRKKEKIAGAVLCYKALLDLGIDEQSVSYKTSPNGKPIFDNLDNLYFNISHSDNAAILAISNQNVGIDIQKVNSNTKNIANRFFTRDENVYLSSLDNDLKNDAFFRIWTIKESYIKFSGNGLRTPLDSFNVILNDNQAYIENKKLCIQEYNLLPEYKVSVCLKEPENDTEIYFI